jgi:hypothetical protein
MPTTDGPRDAVAVESGVGDKLISAYTFMLDHIVLLVWSITVVAALLLSIAKYKHDHPSTPFSTEIWYQRSSPYQILALAFKHFIKPQSSRWFILVWLIVALAFVVVKYTVPIIFAPYIKIGNGAPVNTSAIFVPLRGTAGLNDPSDQLSLRIFELNVPAALRAVGSVDGVQGTIAGSSPVTVDLPETIGQFGIGDFSQPIQRIGYRYSVTGLDLGLQFYPDLVFNVEGSCVTEYGWWAGTLLSNNSVCPGEFVDVYNVFNSTKDPQPVSRCDAGPRAFFQLGPPPPASSGNWTWAAIISTFNRTSFFPGTDPCYLTAEDSPNPAIGKWTVLPGRPALSCWENDVWSYQGYNATLLGLNGTIPGLDLSTGILDILTSYLSVPMIFLLGTYLQASALKSSTTAVQEIIDANTSSIYSDLQRLVFASYIATTNTLTQTTLYPPTDAVSNLVAQNGTILDGAGDFIILSGDIATLSVRSLIVIPTLAVSLWIVYLTLMFMPLPKEALAALTPAPEAAIPEPPTRSDSKVEKGIGGTLQAVVDNFNNS